MSDIKKQLKNQLNDLAGKKVIDEPKKKTKTFKQDKSKSMIGILFDKDDRGILEKHFKLLGVSQLSEGIRRIIYQYMKENDLL